MNIFRAIADKIEKETGLGCVYSEANIEANKISVDIRAVELTGIDGKYDVSGSLSIKTSTMDGWQILTQILELDCINGRRAVSSFSDLNGFNMMSVDFSMIIEDAREPRKRTVEKVECSEGIKCQE